MPAATNDGASNKKNVKNVQTRGAAWDPAAVPAKSRSLREEEERQFHATHFTADPRGAAMSGAPPAGRRKKRGGTPPDASARDDDQPAPRPKRRGGAGPG